MTIAFYLAAGVAIVATLMVVTRSNAVHALLYLVVSILSLALMFLLLGAPFAAALEIIIYAGAILVLFVFVVMMIGMGPEARIAGRQWLSHGAWVVPAILTASLLIEVLYVLGRSPSDVRGIVEVGPRHVGIALLGPYFLAVELASMLLLLGLIGAYHLAYGRQRLPGRKKVEEVQ